MKVGTLLWKSLGVGPLLIFATLTWNGIYIWLGEAGHVLTAQNKMSVQSFEALRLSLAIGWLALEWLWVISIAWIVVTASKRKPKTSNPISDEKEAQA